MISNQAAWPSQEKMFNTSFDPVARVVSSQPATALWCEVYRNEMISLTDVGTRRQVAFFCVSSTIQERNFFFISAK